jgi:hypothetical protein
VTTMRFVLAVTLTLAAVPQAADQRPASSSVEGVWRLTKYEGGGNLGDASGLLILQGGYFSYVYTMNQGRPQPDGRAHAGRYRLEGDALTFIVDWNLHYVDHKGIVDRNGTESRTRVVRDGNTMSVTFDNGAVQRLQRVTPGATP